jgi:hypothetical protein
MVDAKIRLWDPTRLILPEESGEKSVALPPAKQKIPRIVALKRIRISKKKVSHY